MPTVGYETWKILNIVDDRLWKFSTHSVVLISNFIFDFVFSVSFDLIYF